MSNETDLEVDFLTQHSKSSLSTGHPEGTHQDWTRKHSHTRYICRWSCNLLTCLSVEDSPFSNFCISLSCQIQASYTLTRTSLSQLSLSELTRIAGLPQQGKRGTKKNCNRMFLEEWAVFPSLTSLRSGLAEAESWSNHVVPLCLPLTLFCLYIKVKPKPITTLGRNRFSFVQLEGKDVHKTRPSSGLQSPKTQ